MDTQNFTEETSCENCIKCWQVRGHHGNGKKSEVIVQLLCNNSVSQKSGVCCNEIHLQMSTVLEVANRIFSENTFMEQIVYVQEMWLFSSQLYHLLSSAQPNKNEN